MISFKNNNNTEPYRKFRNLYNKAKRKEQTLIQAASIASFSKSSLEVDSRFVNLKILDGEDFIFFTNYESPKSKQFKNHNQISINIYWSSINTQIRMKAIIRRLSKDFNMAYFKTRDLKKNALAISSKQSQVIRSFSDVKKDYDETFANKELTICPEYWGGFAFQPFTFEFWEGHPARLNKRQLYFLETKKWKKSILQP
mgnify:FL=1|tara:strand:+ start:514 stop:1110 length:597 start_codon:yes stop_codon:yes gene_type:complete